MSEPRQFTQAIEIVRGGFATPYTGNDEATGTYRGCLYRPDGSRIDLSERFFGPGYNFRSGNPDQVPPPRPGEVAELAGRSLYLGHYIAHFGHFLTETLSTFWIFGREDAAAFDHIVFHPRAFGTHIPPYARHCLGCFGIDPDRIVFLDRDVVRFEEVVVPERLFRLWNSADPALRPVFERIRDRSPRPPADAPDKLYLSRRNTYFKVPRRIVANEVRLEELFARNGFAVIHPEAVDFRDQVALYGQATVIAGLSGSALHNSLFMRPGGTVIELVHPDIAPADAPATNQELCNRIAGVEGVVVPFKGSSHLGSRVLSYDVRHVAASLAAVLLFGMGIGLAELPHHLLGTVEIGYLHALPVLKRAKSPFVRLRRRYGGTAVKGTGQAARRWGGSR